MREDDKTRLLLALDNKDPSNAAGRVKVSGVTTRDAALVSAASLIGNLRASNISTLNTTSGSKRMVWGVPGFGWSTAAAPTSWDA